MEPADHGQALGEALFANDQIRNGLRDALASIKDLDDADPGRVWLHGADRGRFLQLPSEHRE